MATHHFEKYQPHVYYDRTPEYFRLDNPSDHRCSLCQRPGYEFVIVLEGYQRTILCVDCRVGLEFIQDESYPIITAKKGFGGVYL